MSVTTDPPVICPINPCSIRLHRNYPSYSRRVNSVIPFKTAQMFYVLSPLTGDLTNCGAQCGPCPLPATRIYGTIRNIPPSSTPTQLCSGSKP